jgi:hypothetical protein
MRLNRIKRRYMTRFTLKDGMVLRNRPLTIARKINCLRREGMNQRCQGERTDLLKIREQIKCGVTLETYEINSSALRVIDRYYTYLEEEKTEKSNLYWIYGESGTGKTKWVSENFKDIYWKDDTKWWDGYDRHETIIIDDFRASHMKFNCLLRLLDRYPCKCELKVDIDESQVKTL